MKHILQFSLLDYIEVEGFLVYVRGRLEIKLDESKKKSPDTDYSEPEKIIDYLKKTEDHLHSIYEGNKFLLKESIKTASIITDLENKVWRLEQTIEKQKKEIENLKENLTL